MTRHAFFLALGFALTACSSDPDDSATRLLGEDDSAEVEIDSDLEESGTDETLWAQKGQKWPSWRGRTTITVCWETPGYAQAKGDARAAVLGSWGSALAVDFVGWGDCTRSKTDLRVRIAPERPHVRAEIGFGRALQNVSDGVTLNTPGSAWCGDSKQCDKAMTIHEFGHALGFLHEQDRPNAPSRCPDGSDQHTGTVVKGMYLGTYDPDSIMNYCHNTIANPALSKGDIAAARKWYGAR